MVKVNEKVKRLKEIWERERPEIMDRRFPPILVDIESEVWFDPDTCTSIGPNGEILRKWGTKKEELNKFTEAAQMLTTVWLCDCKENKVVRKISLYRFLHE